MRQSEEYSGIAETEAFGELVRRKRAFLVPTVVFVLLFFEPGALSRLQVDISGPGLYA